MSKSIYEISAAHTIRDDAGSDSIIRLGQSNKDASSEGMSDWGY